MIPSSDRSAPRSEQEIIAELATLCVSPGYAHVIASFCFRDNIVKYSGDGLKVDDYLNLHSPNRLNRPEISTLIGLMLRADIDLARPGSVQFKHYFERTEELLRELQHAMNVPMLAALNAEALSKGGDPFSQGAYYREPIFYSGESAYVFQYRDFSVWKYSNDDAWLLANKGFAIADARAVAAALEEFQEKKLLGTLIALRDTSPDQWTVLPGFTFSLQDLVNGLRIAPEVVKAVVAAFTFPSADRNSTFVHLDDYNAANAFPIISIGDDQFILFQSYSLAEALYESPFYWLGADKAYASLAMKHRGEATEAFARERLGRVFGKAHVHAGVNIMASKGHAVGEIDVLVLFGNRAIVLQAKSKRLTMEARKGNDQVLKSDFKKSIQESYDQGLSCARHLMDGKHKLVDANGLEIQLPMTMREVYIVCLISDHYPALSFQARHFLKANTSLQIPAPFVMDVFALDAMTEMLESPLRLLSYIERRVKYTEVVMAGHELTILAYHLRKNLWFDSEFDMAILDDDVAVSLDIAMASRRAGIPGEKIPDGVLTRLHKTSLGRVVSDIEARPDPASIDLGFLLLTIGEETMIKVSEAIDALSKQAAIDGNFHDITIAVGNTGLTVHVHDRPTSEARERLRGHCDLRKYSQKAPTWFGLCLGSDRSVRFGLRLDHEWQQDDEMDKLVGAMPAPKKFSALGRLSKTRKIGRNDKCPCGSGKKYKKCHGAN